MTRLRLGDGPACRIVPAVRVKPRLLPPALLRDDRLPTCGRVAEAQSAPVRRDESAALEEAAKSAKALLDRIQLRAKIDRLSRERDAREAEEQHRNAVRKRAMYALLALVLLVLAV